MLRFGLVGTGAMAATILPAFRNTSDVEIAAVASRSAERSRRFAKAFGISKAYDSLDAMLDDGSIHAIYIANETAEHEKTSIAALMAGKAVLCEKPFATTEEEGARIAFAARESRRLFMEAIWTHLLPSHQRFIDLVNSARFGRPRHLYCDFGYPTNETVSPRLFDAIGGGGVLLDRGGYLVSLALRLFGPVKNVDARLLKNEAGVDLHASLQLLHESGNQSQLSMSLVALMSNTAVAACSEGTVRLMSPLLGSEAVVTHRMSAPPAHSASDVLPGYRQKAALHLRRFPGLRRLKRALSADRREFLSYGTNQYVSMLGHFRDAFVGGKLESDIVPLALSLDTIRIIQSARLGRHTG